MGLPRAMSWQVYARCASINVARGTLQLYRRDSWAWPAAATLATDRLGDSFHKMGFLRWRGKGRSVSPPRNLLGTQCAGAFSRRPDKAGAQIQLIMASHHCSDSQSHSQMQGRCSRETCRLSYPRCSPKHRCLDASACSPPFLIGVQGSDASSALADRSARCASLFAQFKDECRTELKSRRDFVVYQGCSEVDPTALSERWLVCSLSWTQLNSSEPRKHSKPAIYCLLCICS